MRAPRLAGDRDGKTLGLKVLGQLAQLCGFARAIETFKSEEETHKRRVQGDWPSRRMRFAPGPSALANAAHAAVEFDART